MKDLNTTIDKNKYLSEAIGRLIKFEGSNVFGCDYFAQSRALLDLIELQSYKVKQIIETGHIYSDIWKNLLDSLEALHTSARILLEQINEEDFDAISELLNNAIESVNARS